MKTFKPGDIAVILGVSISSIRNWTDQAEVREFLSDMAKRVGTYENMKQREYTQQDLYVLNTVAKQKTRFNSWNDIAHYLREGHLDTELPPSAALVMPMTAAEGFADALILRERLEILNKALEDADQEIEYWRERVDNVREEEQNKSREREEKLREEIIELHRQLARMELRMEMLQNKKE